MNKRKMKKLKEEFLKLFCSQVKEPWVDDAGEKLYLFKNSIGEARPRLLWKWIEEKFGNNEK